MRVGNVISMLVEILRGRDLLLLYRINTLNWQLWELEEMMVWDMMDLIMLLSLSLIYSRILVDPLMLILVFKWVNLARVIVRILSVLQRLSYLKQKRLKGVLKLNTTSL